jgi:integrase/recombinase XerD
MSKNAGKKEIMFGKPSQKTFEQLCEGHQNYCRMNNLSPVTMNTYSISSRYFIHFIGENVFCTEITQDTINNYKLHLFDVRNVSAVTVNTYLHNLSPLIKYGMKRGYINTHIEFKESKAQERI